MTEEVWKPIHGWETFEASNLGRVRALVNTRQRRLETPRLKKTTLRLRDGRPYVSLSADYRRTTQQVGHLVLLAFVGPPPPGTEASHIDGDFHNNQLDNLVWETHIENMARKADHGTVARGSKHGISKLHERDIPVMRRLLDSKVPGRVVAAAFEVSEATVSNIKNGVKWRHVTRSPSSP